MAMNPDYLGVQTGLLSAISGGTYTYVAGRAVRMGSDGKLQGPTADQRVIGLVNESQISGVVDEITGRYGIYGSTKATVVHSGIVTVRQSVYNGTSYSVYDEAQTYTANDDIYATASTGVLTNQQPDATGPRGLTSLFVGKVLIAPTNPANGDPMTITVQCN